MVTVAANVAGMRCAQCDVTLIVGTLSPKPLPHVMVMLFDGRPRDGSEIAPRLCSIDCATAWLTEHWKAPATKAAPPPSSLHVSMGVMTTTDPMPEPPDS